MCACPWRYQNRALYGLQGSCDTDQGARSISLQLLLPWKTSSNMTKIDCLLKASLASWQTRKCALMSPWSGRHFSNPAARQLIRVYLSDLLPKCTYCRIFFPNHFYFFAFLALLQFSWQYNIAAIFFWDETSFIRRDVKAAILVRSSSLYQT